MVVVGLRWRCQTRVDAPTELVRQPRGGAASVRLDDRPNYSGFGFNRDYERFQYIE